MNIIKKIRVSGKLIIIFLLGVIMLLFFLFLYIQNYSITDIEADNYEKLLSKSDENVLKSGVYQMFDDASIIFAKGVVSAPGFEITVEKTGDSLPFVTLKNRAKDVEYKILWRDNDNNTIDAKFISVGTINYRFSEPFKIALNSLMITEGFILKESLYTYGRDIIIKETQNAFIIGSLSSKYKDGIGYISFTAYKKRKYLQFL